MAVTASPRLGITRWSVDGDPVTRAQFETSHGQLELLAVGFLQGTAAARPAAAAGNLGFIYRATDTGVFSWSTGAAWVALGGGDGGFAKSFLTMG